MRFEFDNTVCLVKPENAMEIAALEVVRTDTKTMAPGAKYMDKYKEHLKCKKALNDYIKNKKKYLAKRHKYKKDGKEHSETNEEFFERKGIKDIKKHLEDKLSKTWNGKTSIISKIHPMNGAQFPTGMLPHVYERFITTIPVGNISFNDLRIKPSSISGQHNVPLRGYQQEALDAALNNTFNGMPWPCGVLKIATGGGKTELSVAMYQTNKMPTVFVVHRKHLITQAINRFKKYGITAGQIGDSVFDPDPQGITVATIQTLHNKLKNGTASEINQFIKAGQIFFDEAHLCAAKLDEGNQFITLSRQFRHAYMRFGLTATPFMKDEYSNQLLMGATGDILFEISNDALIKAGYLTKPKVTIIKMPPVSCPKSWPECYESAIVLNSQRNLRIITELKKIPKPAIIMVNRVAHAKALQSVANSLGIPSPAIPIIQGSTSSEGRAQVIADLQSMKIKHIIATIFDEGTDIPELRSIILGGGGKSKVAMLQRVGRTLRKAPKKHEALIIDFEDTSGTILKNHSASRKKVWIDEGFQIEET
jgi:superfamily II DNA or RNA helicase